MGPDAAFERRNCCKTHNPKTALISHCDHTRGEGRHGKSKSSCGNRLCRTPENQFMDLSFRKSLTPSRKSMPSRLSKVTINEDLKRGSVYQNSESVRKLQGLRTIQSSRNRDVSLTFTIIDSLSRHSKNDGDSLAQKKRSLQIPSYAVDNPTYIGKNYIESCSQEFADTSYHLPKDHISTHQKAVDGPQDSFLEICWDSKDEEWCCSEAVAKTLETGPGEEVMTCDRPSTSESDGSVLLEREKAQNLSKSTSANVGMADWPYQSESNCSKANPKSRFSPLRRMLGPIKKSKSQRNPTFSTKDVDGYTTPSSSPSIMRDRMLQKSLLQDFSKASHLTERDGLLFKNSLQNSVIASSPAHLRGLLKLEYKHDALSFEFSVRDPEEILSAKIWKTDNTLNWVYTFYSVAGKNRSHRQKQPSMVGQMQVSCYLCSEMRSGSLDTSTVMEFVLYDIAQARKSLACPEDHAGEGLGTSDREFSGLSGPDRRTFRPAHALLKNGSDAYPWNHTELRSYLEIAAIVIEVPFEKRESLKGKIGERVGTCIEVVSSPNEDPVHRSASQKNVTVVAASGTHGLPNTGDGWPSKLLDRWRSGGGCDCGGWDMTCPIVILNNPDIENVTDQPFAEDPWPLELFVQGSKEKIPALTLSATGEGEYLISFHARLSTLQAFSICVALLHTTEVSTAVGQEQNAYRLQCNSLKLLLEEEVRYLVEAVADEEKRKATKRKGDIPPYLVPDPPFSPIGRV